jgi:hypothetical protein
MKKTKLIVDSWQRQEAGGSSRRQEAGAGGSSRRQEQEAGGRRQVAAALVSPVTSHSFELNTGYRFQNFLHFNLHLQRFIARHQGKPG